MDFTTKVLDRVGRLWANLKAQQQQQGAGGTTNNPQSDSINAVVVDPANHAAEVAGAIPVKLGPPAPYPTQPQIVHLHHQQQPPVYTPPAVAPGSQQQQKQQPPPHPVLPLNQPNHTPTHHQHHHHSSAHTTPSPLAYPPPSQSSSHSSIHSPAHHPPLTGVTSSGGNTSHHPSHHMLVSSSSQPLMTNHSSSVTSPHYPFSIGSSTTTSTTSNSPSSIVSPTPPPAPHSAGPHGLPPSSGSFSAAQTPESPSLSGFRRQLSLNMFQRGRDLNKPSGGLYLDFGRAGGGPKGAASQGSISGANDLIDCHSLSPRPRPKNLGLSNSHDNISKNSAASHSMFHQQNNHHGPFGQPASASSRTHGRSNFHAFNFNNSPGGGLPTGSVRSQFVAYPNQPSTRLKEEFAKNNRTIKINGKKYENIKEEDFKKISELGAGSFGQVEKMLHKPSNTELAVKKMRRSGNQDDNKHIINDLELLRKCVDFANIVQCYGYYIMETEVWIFMELMTTCFDRLLKRLKEPVPEAIIGKIAVATVSTLDYLKVNHGVIHRDIKPSNILINRQGIIKLCDFGISGRLIDSKAHTRSVGCAAYLAPERIQPPDSTGTYDIRSDVWSLGITLVEIATGHFPYQNWTSDFELLSKVIQEDPPILPEESGNFSADFRDFIKACLTKDYAKRPKYQVLMTHKFYQKYKTEPVDVAEWFRNAYVESNSTTSSTSSLASFRNP